jgi:hypothetical protein
MPDKDVLGKADGLMRRHALPLPGSGSDAGGVPVLTELVETTTATQAAVSDIGASVLDRLMQQVEGRLRAEVEKRVAEQMTSQVQAAVSGALGDLRKELAMAIAEAVRQELERRQIK